MNFLPIDLEYTKLQKKGWTFFACEFEEHESSKALGPDKISNLHLKHLGPAGLKYLTEIFNISVATSTIPTIWKCSVIIPLLKPEKEAVERFEPDLPPTRDKKMVQLLSPRSSVQGQFSQCDLDLEERQDRCTAVTSPILFNFIFLNYRHPLRGYFSSSTQTIFQCIAPAHLWSPSATSSTGTR